MSDDTMTDKLSEALAWYDDDDIDHRLHPHFATALDAARRWASFPTDEDRERAEQALMEWLPDTFGPWLAEGAVKTVLEAVKREDR